MTDLQVQKIIDDKVSDAADQAVLKAYIDKLHAQITQLGGGALRIFVAGDRSSVGKSSVCLGLLGNLLKQGYAPGDLAYIKPATQCEAPQLVQAYCESVGIACVAVGPLVYYKGFTRAFLAGETGQTSDDLLETCGKAVDDVAKGKRVVLIDGVGFPAVGSICGTDNASVCKACSYPSPSGAAQRSPMGVLLVGGSGVGMAVDSFNINATYFEAAGVPVLGAIFNKLSTEGYYSLDKIATQLKSYFGQNEKQKRLGRVPFGFVPLFAGIAGDNASALKNVDEYLKIFGEHVEIDKILDSAKRIQRQAVENGGGATNGATAAATEPPAKKAKTTAAEGHFIKTENASHQVVVWSKSFCPHCKKTKELFSGMDGVKMVVHELDLMDNGKELQEELFQMTGQKSVPNVFVNNHHVGGNDDTQQAHKDGTLKDLLDGKKPAANGKKGLSRKDIEKLAQKQGAAKGG